MNTTVDKVTWAQLTMWVYSLEIADRRSAALFKYTSTFLFRYCSVRTGSCQSSLISNSGIFLVRAFSRTRRSRCKETRSLYVLDFNQFKNCGLSVLDAWLQKTKLTPSCGTRKMLSALILHHYVLAVIVWFLFAALISFLLAPDACLSNHKHHGNCREVKYTSVLYVQIYDNFHRSLSE